MTQRLTLRVKRFVLEAHGSVCFYCGSKAAHVDHIVPRRGGGTDDLPNLIAACRWCNSSKGGWELPDKRLQAALAAAAAVEPAIRERESLAIQEDIARKQPVKSVQLAVRMTGEFRVALEAAAERTGHTLSGYILWVMRETLRREGFYVTAAAKRATRKK